MASVVEAPHTKLLMQAEDLVEKSGITRAQVINLVSTLVGPSDQPEEAPASTTVESLCMFDSLERIMGDVLEDLQAIRDAVARV